LPIAAGKVRAGFRSPTDDFTVRRQDLNELLITHSTATFFWAAAARPWRVRASMMATFWG
jgi:DNA polymerase V